MEARMPQPATAPDEAGGRRSAGRAYDREKLERMLANEADMSFKRRATSVFDFLNIQPGDRVLDAGCGRGFYLNFLRELHPEAIVTGIELDLPLLPRALAAVPGSQLTGANLYHLPFADGSFDKIIFSEVIEHVPDDAAALAELYRILAPGGRLALTTPNADYPLLWDPLNKVLEATTGGHIQRGPLAGIWANHVRLYSLESLEQVVTEAGFHIARLKCHTRFAFPFIHNLVYGLGKELLERGVLPESMAQAADRYALDEDPKRGSFLNPVRLGLRAFNAVDALNDRFPPRPDRPFLIIALDLRKPLDAGSP
jgi:SAM-dependent methyltransferase